MAPGRRAPGTGARRQRRDRDGKCGCNASAGNMERSNHQPARPHPGTCAMLREGRSSGLPSSFPAHAFPCTGTVAFERSRQAYSSGGCAGLARDGYRARHRLPVSPSGRRAGGHHSLDGGDSKSGATGCHRLIVLLTRKNGEALARPRRFRRGACRASCPARIRQAYLPARRRRAAPMPSRPAPSRTSDTGSGTSAAASASSTLSDELAK